MSEVVVSAGWRLSVIGMIFAVGMLGLWLTAIGMLDLLHANLAGGLQLLAGLGCGSGAWAIARLRNDLVGD
ncbi:MAG TPA: hypothetical protein PKB10_07375 [Tepidisphaeraceae bacterium]|nr:hypothetical protein [Tepidisphaeraceae bacterium]